MHHQFVKEIDDFVAATKILIGVDDVQTFFPGREGDHEWEAEYPVEVNGEQFGQTLRIVTRPFESSIDWSIVLIMPPAVSRLDFTAIPHPNPPRAFGETHAGSVAGPHIHRWTPNKRFMTSRKSTNGIPIAELVPQMKDFETHLRWFCKENNISLPHDHRIVLADRPRLFK